MTKGEETLAILNMLIRVKVAPSKIHGVGLVAMRDITKDTKLNLTMFPQAYKVPKGSLNKLFPEVKQLIIERWPMILEGDGFMYPDTLLQAYLNHSEDPNYDYSTDKLLKDVKKGEEILGDYKKILTWKEAFPWLSTLPKRKKEL